MTSRVSFMARNAPKLLYSLAILYFAVRIAIPIYEYITLGYSPTAPISDLQLIHVYYINYAVDTALNSVFLAANGVIAEILLAIWRTLQARDAA